VHTIFALYSPSYPLYPPITPLTCTNLSFPAGPVLPSCSPTLYEEKRKKLKMIFLLVGDKGRYPESFLVIFPCIYVLQPQLVHYLKFSSFYFSPFLIVLSTSL
jgi:hypothetical protein